MNKPSPNPSRKREGDLFGERARWLSGAAARLLEWRPDEFWAATPAELLAMVVEQEVDPVAGDELARLMAAFPDGGTDGR